MCAINLTNLGRIYHASRRNFEKYGDVSAAAAATEESGGAYRRHQVKVFLPVLLWMLSYILRFQLVVMGMLHLPFTARSIGWTA